MVTQSKTHRAQWKHVKGSIQRDPGGRPTHSVFKCLVCQQNRTIPANQLAPANETHDNRR